MSRNQKYYDDDDMYDYDDDEDYAAPPKPKPKAPKAPVTASQTKGVAVVKPIPKSNANMNSKLNASTNTTTVFKAAATSSTASTSAANVSKAPQSIQPASAKVTTIAQSLSESSVKDTSNADKTLETQSTTLTTSSSSNASSQHFPYEDFSDDENKELEDSKYTTSTSTSISTTVAKPNIIVVITGHVDAGKSTLLGHLLYNLGDVSQRIMHKYERQSQEVGKGSFALAWVMDDTQSERDRGVTIDIAERYISTDQRNITLIDSPGHRDFVPAMISGAHQADAAVLVIPATEGEFESAMSENAQTFEHAQLLQALGVKHVIVAVNKMDSTLPEPWSEARFHQVSTAVRQLLTEQLDFKEENVVFVPVSGLSGTNLQSPTATRLPVAASGTDRSIPAVPNWYTGATLLDCLNAVPTRRVNSSNSNNTSNNSSNSSSNKHTISTSSSNIIPTNTLNTINNTNQKQDSPIISKIINNNSFRAVVSGIVSEGTIHKGFDISAVILRGKIHINRTIGIADVAVCTVKKIVNSRTNGAAGVSAGSMEFAQAGDNVILTLLDRQGRPFQELIHLRSGVCLYKDRFSVVRCPTQIVAMIKISPSVPTPVLMGTAFEFYSHGAEVECFIAKIINVELKSISSYYNSSSSSSSSTINNSNHPSNNHSTSSSSSSSSSIQPQKSKWKCIPVNATATVEIVCKTAIALESFQDFEPFGRFILRTHGKTVALGKCIEIKT